MTKSNSSVNRGTSSCAVLLLALTGSGTSCSESARSAGTAPRAVEESAAPVMGTPSAIDTAGSSSAGGATGSEASAEGRAAIADAGAPDAVATAGDSSPASAGAPKPPARDGAGGVVLTAVVVSVRDGVRAIAAQWLNGTDRVIFLRGCGTADGWYLSDGEWREHGQFALCAAETKTIEVSPGETYVDLVGAAAPPQRGSNVWRLVARYGTGCRSGELFAASECREIHELVSVNQLRWP